MSLSLSPQLHATITLPTSKSISARALILHALSQCKAPLLGLSDCDDTRAVVAALRDNPDLIDIGAAGTAMRFLTAYFATGEGETHILTGTKRMLQRPIGILVDALQQLGADIDYLGEPGFPPLRIRGRQLAGGEVSLPANVSSQYISALLMIGATLRDGLTLHLVGEIASAPYITMTLQLMKEFGGTAHWIDSNHIRVDPQPLTREIPLAIEPDWSAASYWYELMAITSDAEASVTLTGLTETSVQGDSACAALFAPLGVATTFTAEGAILTKAPTVANDLYRADFTDTPDLAQAVVVACAMRRQPFHFSGLKSLKIKETDRIAALTQELAKYGFMLHEPAEGELAWHTPNCHNVPTDTPISVATYEDHRMAMAFAPTALCFSSVNIEHPEVVSKSYPTFWTDWEKLAL